MEMHEIKDLLATPQLPDLGPGPRPGCKSTSILNQQLEEIFHARAVSESIQPSIRSAVFLWHDHLDASHEISQEIHNPNGSFLHGIMHRREPDYSNAKYWFRRVGDHPVYPVLAKRVAEFLSGRNKDLSARLVPGGVWDPFGFVDLCEENAGRSSSEPEMKLLQEVQRIEFETLLEHIWSEK